MKNIFWAFGAGLVLLSSCSAPLQESGVPSSVSSVTASASVSPPKSASPENLDSSESASSTGPVYAEVDEWISLDDSRIASAYQEFMKQAETADASVSGYGFLYVTDPEGNPVQNLWFYWPDSETHYYSMPCGLLPVALMRSHYEKMRQEPDLHYIGEIVLADPNANDPSRQRWYSVEWDPSGTRAYHVVWDIETPDVWIETADEAVTIFITNADGSPSAGRFSRISLDADTSLFAATASPSYKEPASREIFPDQDEIKPNIQTGPWFPPYDIPDPMIGSISGMETGRYLDPAGKMSFVLSPAVTPESGAVYQLEISDSNLCPGGSCQILKTPVFDENGELRTQIELKLS